MFDRAVRVCCVCCVLFRILSKQGIKVTVQSSRNSLEHSGSDREGGRQLVRPARGVCVGRTKANLAVVVDVRMEHFGEKSY